MILPKADLTLDTWVAYYLYSFDRGTVDLAEYMFDVII